MFFEASPADVSGKLREGAFFAVPRIPGLVSLQFVHRLTEQIRPGDCPVINS